MNEHPARPEPLENSVHQAERFTSGSRTDAGCQSGGWQPIETAPQDGYFLVYEDGAMRALLRIAGVWHKTGYPAIIYPPWNDVLVGDDAKRVLPPGCRLEVRDGCCENPTHWMPLPESPEAGPLSEHA